MAAALRTGRARGFTLEIRHSVFQLAPDCCAVSRPLAMARRTDVASVTCPYCFEVVELYVDPESEGTFVEDCAVCCRPWTVSVGRDELTGELVVDVARA